MTRNEARMDLQGWQPDPFGVHGYRFFRDGRPSGLVMDNGVQSYDEPPQQDEDLSADPQQEAPELSTSSYTSLAGWYRDPLGEGMRYWDGAQWTNFAAESEFQAISELSHLVNDPVDQMDDEPQPAATHRTEADPTATPSSAGWWQASDGRWYPPESHPDRAESSSPATAPSQQPTPPRPESTGPVTSERLVGQRNGDAGPAAHCPKRPFYKEPWFWVAVAAVMARPRRRAPSDNAS